MEGIEEEKNSNLGKSEGSVLKENVNHSNMPKINSKFRKKGLEIKTNVNKSTEHDESQNQSKLHKIEKDIEDYLNNQTNSSNQSQIKKKNSKKRKRIKTEAETSQEQRLTPRFDKKTTRSEESENRLSLFKRFGSSKRKSSKAKKKKRPATVEELSEEQIEDQLSPFVIKGVFN